MTEQSPILIAAGGTGGHVFPALAVAEELRNRCIPVVWVGTRKGIEARIIPAAGLPIEWLQVAGLRGNGVLRLLGAPWTLLIALLQALKILRKHKPRAVLGMGGFVSGPVGVAAKLLRIPLVLHEQNAIAGLTNKLLSRIANVVLQAFPNAFSTATNLQTVGNPVREDIIACRQTKLRGDRLHLLVVGGSLGAEFFNVEVPQAVSRLQTPVQVTHQTGRGRQSQVSQRYQELGLENNATVVEFIDDMAKAYAQADLVLCRSGAMTVSELASAGLPAIFVPYPYAVDDHQTHNANVMVDAGAARILQQTGTDAEKLAACIAELSDSSLRESMSQQAFNLAANDAAYVIANILLEVRV